MARGFIACDREQSFLMPPDVREWLPKDHFAWFVLDGLRKTPRPGSSSGRYAFMRNVLQTEQGIAV